MLFQSIAGQVTKGIAERANSQAAYLRKQEARKRLDYYQDLQLEYVREDLARLWAEPDQLDPVFVNVVRKIVDNLAQVYREPPVRLVQGGSERDGKVFVELAESCALDAKMKLVSRYAKLLKTVLLRPVWRNGRMDLDLLTPDVLDVETGDTPEDLKTVVITHYGPGEKVEDITYSQWTVETWKRFDARGREIASGSNPYGVLPFIPVWDRLPMADFWLPGGDDLITAQDAVNRAITDFCYVLRMQGFGVAVGKGMASAFGTNNQLQIGPGAVVELPAEGDFDYVSTQAPIAELLESVQRIMTWAAVTNGLSASLLSSRPTGETGISKVVGNLEMQEKRRDDVALFRVYEQRLFDALRAVWNHHNPSRQISTGASLDVDFFDPRPSIYAQEQAESWKMLLEMGVISQVDIVMERNPDIRTREQAREHLEKLKAEAQKTRPPSMDEIMEMRVLGFVPDEVLAARLEEMGLIESESMPKVQAAIKQKGRTQVRLAEEQAGYDEWAAGNKALQENQ